MAVERSWVRCLGGDLHGYMAQVPNEYIEGDLELGTVFQLGSSPTQWRLAELTLKIEDIEDQCMVLVPVGASAEGSLDKLLQPEQRPTVEAKRRADDPPA